ncbi:MAG: hypothetical protein VKJ44_06875 [Synechococcus sp.]|nr:hypothetical protein [Synechococcus sp.]
MPEPVAPEAAAAHRSAAEVAPSAVSARAHLALWGCSPGLEPPLAGAAPPPAGPRLVLSAAVQDGWRAFCRAPRVFVAVALLVTLLQVAIHPFTALIGSRAHPSGDPRAWLLYLLGLGFSLGLNLWARLALVRGAWIALAGGRPSLALLLRWNGPASRRLLAAWLHLLAVILLPLAGACLLLGMPLLLLTLPQVQRVLGPDLLRLLALTLALLLLLALVLALLHALHQLLGQTLLLQVVALEGLAGAEAVARAQRLVEPQRPLLLLLVIGQILVYGLGLAACVLGVLVAWPTVICISSAAYRQLRQAEAAAGRPAAGTTALAAPGG